MEYTFEDLLSTLNDDSKYILKKINNYIKDNYADYRPFDIKPKNKDKLDWVCNYRKKPKTGKPICNIYSNSGILSIHFVFFTSMARETLLRIDSFNEKIRSTIRKRCRCRACRNGKYGCEWRQFFYIGKSVFSCCCSPYVHIQEITEENLSDIFLLITLQMKHMSQNPMEIKGAGYSEKNKLRCGDVNVVSLPSIKLDIVEINVNDHVNIMKFERYLKLYSLAPLGQSDGIWCFDSDEIACDKSIFDNVCYCLSEIPANNYLSVTVSDPMTFSYSRAYSYISRWALENKYKICNIIAENVTTPGFVRFYKENSDEYMSVYIPFEKMIEKEMK